MILISSKIDRAIQGNLLLPKGYGTPQTLKPLLLPGEERSVAGFDIEADSITAEPFLLCYSTDDKNGYHLFDDSNHKNKAYGVIDFHTKKTFRNSINCYYNLSYDFEGMVKLFGREVAILLYGQMTAFLDEDCNALTLEKAKDEGRTYEYKVTYIPKKAFHIKIKEDKKYSYYDILQYYQTSLSKAAAKYLGKEDKKDDFNAAYTSRGLFNGSTTIENEITRFTSHIQNNLLFAVKDKIEKIEEMTKFFKSFDSPQDYRNKCIKYCIQDANICRKLGHIIVNGVNSFR